MTSETATPRQIAEACFEQSKEFPPVEYLGKWKVAAAFRAGAVSDEAEFTRMVQVALSSMQDKPLSLWIVLQAHDPSTAGLPSDTAPSTKSERNDQLSLEGVVFLLEIKQEATPQAGVGAVLPGESTESKIRAQIDAGLRGQFGGSFDRVVSVEKVELPREVKDLLAKLRPLLSPLSAHVRKCLVGEW
ncbi:MAG: hypothetical protein ABIK09_15355 [Pseudomonadota bacterium]